MKIPCIIITLLLSLYLSKAAEVSTVPAIIGTYTNLELAVNFPTNWVVKVDKSSQILSLIAPSGDANVQIQVLYTDDSLDSSVEASRSTLQQLQFKLTRDEKFTFNKLPGHLFEGTLPPNAGITATPPLLCILIIQTNNVHNLKKNCSFIFVF